MNEKHIQQVLEIEKQVQEIQENAIRAAQEIPVKAEQEAQAMISRARREAEQEAREIIAAARSADAARNVTEKVGEKSDQFDILAKKNFDQAVAYILERVIGKV